MLDRSKCKKMLVWDKRGQEKLKRIVVEIFESRGCMAVLDGHEQNFYNNKVFDVVYWKCYEEIPEKKPLTVLDVMWAEGVRNVMRMKGGENFYDARFITSGEVVEGKEMNRLIKKDGVVQLEGEWRSVEEFYGGLC